MSPSHTPKRPSRLLIARMREAAERFGISSHDDSLQAPRAKFAPKFPKTASLSILRSRMWWWSYTGKGSSGKLSRVFPPPKGASKDYPIRQWQNFKDLFEPSALFYEFRARYEGRYAYEFGVPWINCTWWQKWALRGLVPDPFPDQYFSPTSEGDNDWVTLQLPVNLRWTDTAVKQCFESELMRLRKERGIERGRVRTRDLPWMSIETMDMKRYKITEEKILPGGPKAVHKQLQTYLVQCKQLGIKP